MSVYEQHHPGAPVVALVTDAESIEASEVPLAERSDATSQSDGRNDFTAASPLLGASVLVFGAIASFSLVAFGVFTWQRGKTVKTRRRRTNVRRRRTNSEIELHSPTNRL
jgi:hypothetical protein